jgi:hypothetical protein
MCRIERNPHARHDANLSVHALPGVNIWQVQFLNWSKRCTHPYARAGNEWPGGCMSAWGQNLPSRDFCGTAALPLKPDIC